MTNDAMLKHPYICYSFEMQRPLSKKGLNLRKILKVFTINDPKFSNKIEAIYDEQMIRL